MRESERETHFRTTQTFITVIEIIAHFAFAKAERNRDEAEWQKAKGERKAEAKRGRQTQAKSKARPLAACCAILAC